jgi:hypothetical protein
MTGPTRTRSDYNLGKHDLLVEYCFKASDQNGEVFGLSDIIDTTWVDSTKWPPGITPMFPDGFQENLRIAMSSFLGCLSRELMKRRRTPETPRNPGPASTNGDKTGATR